MHCGRRHSSFTSPSSDNPGQPAWTLLVLGTTFVRMPAFRTQERQGSQRLEGDPGVFNFPQTSLQKRVVKLHLAVRRA